jgi:hypothetical protein
MKSKCREEFRRCFNAAMRFRKLRIAWSVAWGIIALMLCVLWVRSYWWVDTWYGKHISVASYCGQLAVYLLEQPNTNWKGTSLKIEGEVVQMVEVWKIRSKIFDNAGVGEFGSTIPQWCAVVLFALMAIIPWISVRRFSLRTLLIATTIVAILMGVIAWSIAGN